MNEVDELDGWEMWDEFRRSARAARCHICGGVIPSGKLHWDHLVPLRAGGAHETHNVLPAHASCNLSRGAGRRLSAQLPLVPAGEDFRDSRWAWRR